MPSIPSHLAWFRSGMDLCPRLAGGLLLVAGGISLGGTLANRPNFAGEIADLPPMSAASAVAMILLGSALLLCSSATPLALKAGRAAAWSAVLTGLASLLWSSTPVLPGPGGPESLRWLEWLGIMGVALALLLVKSRRGLRLGQGLALMAVLSFLVVSLTFLFIQTPSDAPLVIGQLGLLEAICFLVASWGVFCSGRETGLMALLHRDTPGGQAARRLLPAAVLVPITLGILRHFGQVYGLFGTGFGIAFLITTGVGIVSFVVWHTALRLDSVDAERRKLDETRARSEARLRMAEKVARLGTWDWNITDDSLEWSDEAFHVYGLPTEAGPPRTEQFMQMVLPQDREALRQAFRESLQGVKPFALEYRFNRPDGRPIHVLVQGEVLRDEDGKPVRMRGTAQDVSEKARLQQQLHQAQKMEGIGRLAGGVAHDFNNLLTAILGYTELAQKASAPDSPAYRHLAHVRQAADRAAALTQQLLAFARKQIIEPKVICLNDVLSSMDKMLRRLLQENIEIVTLPARGLWLVRVDPTQIEQVLLNLAVNARDAMPHGGKLVLETGNAALDEQYCASRPDLRPGEYVVLSVTDTGSGMSDEVKSHLFEPFFTTKELGKGTGLGLATVFGIVKQAEGHIAVYSEPGRGSMFRIYLPRTAMPASTRHISDNIDKTRGGTETILVVEDEPMIRRLIVDTLSSLGYTVLEASNGEEALTRAADISQPIHLLLTDVVMPRMGGRKLADALMASRPRLAVLYISGYTENAIVHQGELDAHVEFMHKPFTHAALTRRVRDILDARAGLTE